MLLTKKIRLFPTEEQELLMWKTCGCCRYIYNWFLLLNIENYNANHDFRKYNYSKQKKDNKDKFIITIYFIFD